MILWRRGLFSLFCEPHPTHISCHTFSDFCLSLLVPPLFPFTSTASHTLLFSLSVLLLLFSLLLSFSVSPTTLSVLTSSHYFYPFFFCSLLFFYFFLSFFLSLSLIVSVFFISFPHSTAFAREQISAISS